MPLEPIKHVNGEALASTGMDVLVGRIPLAQRGLARSRPGLVHITAIPKTALRQSDQNGSSVNQGKCPFAWER